MSVKSDYELAQKALAGDNKSCSLLFNTHYSKLFRFVRSKVNNKTIAEDVTQMALIDAFKYLHTYRGESSFYTWLCSIALRVIYKQPSPSIKSDMELVTTVTPEQVFSSKQSVTNIADAMKQLPAIQQTALYYKIYDILSYKDIAQILGCTPSYAKNLVYEAKKTVKSILQEN